MRVRSEAPKVTAISRGELRRSIPALYDTFWHETKIQHEAPLTTVCEDVAPDSSDSGLSQEILRGFSPPTGLRPGGWQQAATGSRRQGLLMHVLMILVALHAQGALVWETIACRTLRVKLRAGAGKVFAGFWPLKLHKPKPFSCEVLREMKRPKPKGPNPDQGSESAISPA